MLRVRTGRIAEAALIGRLEAQGFRLRALEGLPSFYRVEGGPGPVSLTLEHWLGHVYVQQASTGVAAPVLGPRPGERVLDLCAAPGGKTTHAAELMEHEGCLVACDVSEPRIRGLLGNVCRLGHTNVMVVAADGLDFPEEAGFDRVLVDAPCSGEGTLRRRAGRAPRRSRSFGDYVRRVQEGLLRKAIHVARPGGTVLYVTCTFAPEENEAVVSAVLEDEPVRLEPLELPVPHAPGLTAFEELRFDARLEGAARIYPHHFDSGGLFLAKLVRLDGASRPAAAEPPWRPVPSTFPGGSNTKADAEDTWTGALEALRERFGITTDDLSALDAILRGGRVWLHSMGEWPLEAWGPGRWRSISVGFRAVEFDSRGRARPTNHLLTWASSFVRAGTVDVERGELLSLLAGERIVAEEPPGPTTLRYRGEVIGRAHSDGEGLVSEIPKARAADLGRVVGATGAAPPH